MRLRGSIARESRAVFQSSRLHALVAVLAATFAIATVPLGFIAGTGDFWNMPAGDAAAGQIGWFYYARDSWRFPLLDIGNYHLPEGSNALLSDSLPLFALAAKVFYTLAFPEGSTPPIYMGFWCALCFFLQVAAASRLLFALDVRQPLQHIAGLVFFSYVPLFFLRFGHFGLLGHFLILLSLDAYVRSSRAPLTGRHWLAICSTPVIALLIQPYIAAMCLILVLAAALESWRQRRLSGRGVFVRVGGIAALALALMVVCGGYFAAAGHDFGDYGMYSLNLLSPLIPLPGTLGSRLLHTNVPNIPGLYQWEGGCYLGAGVLTLCVFAIPMAASWRNGLRRHAVLAVLLAATLVFAVSNRIGFGAHEILTIPLPARAIDILSQFRGSGRFVWISVYVLTACLIVAIVRCYPRRASLILVAAALIQIADVVPMQNEVRAASSRAAPTSIHREAWENLIGRHSRVFEFPSFECGGLFNSDVPGGRWRALEIDWLVAKANKPNNSAYLTRYTKDCDRERGQVVADRQAPGTLYLYRSTEDVGTLLAQFGVVSPRCGYLDDVVVCSADMDLSALR